MAVCTLPRVAADLADQHIHMHFYNPADPSGTAHKKLIKMDEENPYVHYYRPIPYETISRTLARYDWGSMLYYIPENDVYVSRYKDAFSSMFLSYLSAELPIVCTDNIAFMAGIVREYGIGVVIESKDIKNISKILALQDVETLKKNVRSLNKKWNIQEQYVPLIDFFRNPRNAPV
jgi:hypothetical protein